ncbi:imidazole glycerol phosphate synthase subunit HisH [Sansalvadorimonas sp. 2012CJ34-2]|uniref:Imidazole glycerol phosphate synthase subunit HisH n=1 Tax=Parendozoicomonas callyspongiae TaxID=2942213 RepID=A0ABT0PKY5_9GAMM|nr:imidazole glycerol phosphate synthase subunit HisH [Sansalvadorimonas sp. 2012CJ34-2]MCL6272042.1 imidazole glycerol phosphate synthase subunit HisH [Sansalvadorimonas sp. 2012CJ34-2]
MIHVVDYGLGNIQAFLTMYKKLGIDATRACNEDQLTDVSKVILPGVGAFDHAMNLLNASGMRKRLEELVNCEQIPVLGVCVGMQILASSSEEGVCDGLSWVDANVCSFANNPASSSLPMPHMGWNDVYPHSESGLFKGFSDDARFYFLHSYYFDCKDQSNRLASAEYGFNLCCAVQKDNIFGVQFHPEKSHHWGAMLLKNFAEL